MDVLKLARNGAGAPRLDIRHGCRDGAVAGIGFRRGCKQDDRICQRQPRLGQSELERAVHAGFHNGDGLRIGKADVLACRAQNAAAGRSQISRLQKTRQIVDGGVRVGAADGLHQRRKAVVMVVAVLVIAHCRPLGELLCILQRQMDLPFLDAPGRKQQLHRVHRLADVAAAGARHMLPHAGLGVRGHAVFLLQIANRARDRLPNTGGRDGLELKDRASRQNGVVDIKIRIFRRRGDQRDLAVFDVLQQRLLLLFVEILDLVKVEQHAVRRHEGVELGIDLLDVARGGRGRVQTAELSLRPRRDEIGHRGLSGAGRAVKDHVRHLTGEDDAAQQAVFPENMLLSADVVQRRRTKRVRKRLIHTRTSSCFVSSLYEILF